jgi:hypothetical protein
MLRLASGVILAVLVAGCSAGGQPSATGRATPSTSLGRASTADATGSRTPLTFDGSAKTGATKPFKLAAATYLVDWTVTAPKGGCYFFLVLSTKASGPVVESAAAVLAKAGQATGSETWHRVRAGTYVLEEDRAGSTNCKGPWKATLTAQ